MKEILAVRLKAPYMYDWLSVFRDPFIRLLIR